MLAAMSLSSAAIGTPLDWQAALGLVSNVRTINKFGRSPTISTADTAGTSFVDVWLGGGKYTGQPDAADTLDVYSSSPDDTGAAGQGARSLSLSGLDANYDPIEETVTMQGTTVSTTTQEFLVMNRAKVLVSGSNQSNVGTITVEQSGDPSVVYATIAPGLAQTQIAAWTTPRDRTSLITGVAIEMARLNGSSGSATVSLRQRDFGSGTYRAISDFEITNSLTPQSLSLPIRIPPKTDLVCRVDSVSDNQTTVCARFDIVEFTDVGA